ncbi:MAG: type II secretion system F family protein [Candidatus Altiarchaeales archaeon]|nr:type II secretion system F family protein [Candidatus Altiarchaeales archaeon]
MKIRKSFRQSVGYSNIKLDPDDFLGFIITFGLIGGSTGGVLLDSFAVLPLALGFIISFALVEMFFYIMISFSIDAKTKEVEEVLPDALQLMSSNVRAGLTTDKALLMAARPEFGAFGEEIRRVGRETMTGRDLASALLDTTTRIKSDHLSRTMDLIVNSIRSGGELADLLDQTSMDLRDQQMMQKEISAGVLMYVIFIFIAIGLGAPGLFAMSSFLVKILSANIKMISSQMPQETTSSSMISLTGVSVEPEFVDLFSTIAISVSCIFGSLIMGLIRTGREKDGVKYMPILLIISLVLFYTIKYAMESLFGGMMG